MNCKTTVGTEAIEKYFEKYNGTGLDKILSAFSIADKALSGISRDNGEPFIFHPLNVAKIVADEIGLQAECVAAVFLHEAMLRNPEIEIDHDKFGREIMTMADGLNKISTIKPKDTKLEAENYKKLIVRYSADPRIIVIKLADRLEVLRNISQFSKASGERKILETMMLYIPLAHQLGLYNIKSEMEDIYFRYAEPEQYRLITNKLKSTEKDRTKIMEEFIEPLKLEIKEAGIKYKLKIRTKTAYSIFKKMQKQKVPFEGVYDVFAIRFIIDCDEEQKTEQDLCWKVYSYVTKEYESDTGRLRDWITNPKSNGYESLHITIKNKSGSYLEVQIRTRRMDEIAENGHAAHWAYKGISQVQSIDNWLTSVRNILESRQPIYPEDLPVPSDKDIFVFTPTGELRILPKGSGVLDFAFNIHSNLGVKCTGARINGKAVSIKEKLSMGDTIEIISGKNQKPSPDWLNFVISSKAKTKIRQMLHEEEYRKAEQGKELLARRLKNWKLNLEDGMMAELMKKHKIGSVNSFYAALCDKIVDINTVKNYILEKTNAENSRLSEGHSPKKTWNGEASSDDILVIGAGDLKGLYYKMSKCCSPVFGDDVFGFVTRESGIKIHRMTCPNASRLMDNYPYRIQKVKWADSPSSGAFQTGIKIIAETENSVINRIMDVISNFKASLRTFNVQENNRNGTYCITLKISVSSNMELEKVISILRTSKNILKVNRI